jgi:eukaryotic-like serine/threonine-protein kinase
MALSTVGPYRVLERLGAGANGEVFLAEDTRLQRRVALKTLSGTAGADAAELRRRLLREARAAARLNHPHIAAVYDVLESDEGVHIVMEYVKGATLSAQVRQSPPAPMQVLDMALQLSDALAHAHGVGVIHRDLKPANIVVGPDGQAKILDFGLARLHAVDLGSAPLSSSELSIDARHTVGTPPYIPPEHLSGAPVDERGDVYSFGVTLFEALTGRRPFEPTGGRGLADAILSAPTPRPRTLCPEVPAGLDAIVFKAMARAPAERYASAAEMRADLRRLASGITDTPTQSRPVVAPRGMSRRKALGAGAAAVAVGLAIYAALGAGVRPAPAASGDGAAARVVAVLPFEGAGVDASTESLATGVADSLITTLSRVPGLTVVSRASTLKYRDRKLEPEAIATELGATLLVDGSVQKSGERLRISVGVLEPGNKAALWQNTYDGAYTDVFSLQREVAEAVASELRLPVRKGRGDDRPTADIEAFADYAQARAFLERADIKENLDRSIGLFDSAIRKDPRFARAHAGLGEAFWRKYQSTRDEKWSIQARDAINEALRLDAGDDSVRLSLATIYRGMGRTDRAIEELISVVRTSPHSDEAHRQLGSAYLAAGKTEPGIDQLREAIRLRPNYMVHHHALGTAYYAAGRFAEAARSFQRIIDLQPDSAIGYSLLGSARHAMDDLEGAAILYERAAALGSANAHANLGSLQFGRGRYDEAARAYAQAIARDPQAPLLHLNLADAYTRLGRAADALASYRRALELSQAQVRVNPTDTRAVARLAVIESKLGQEKDAERHIREAVQREPRNMDVHFYRAVVAVRANRLDEALDALDEAIRCGYSRKRASSDPDLAPLRSLTRYRNLVDGAVRGPV